MKATYQIVEKKDFDENHRKIFAIMLEEQGKVEGPFDNKIDRCNLICVVNIETDVAAIGAVKQKTQSDFSHQKAGIPELSSDFEWELGYFYTRQEYAGQGIASRVAEMLLREHGEGNLMASTEVTANPAMVTILQKNGFRLFGKPWKSGIHGKHLGLFLKFE